MVKADLVKIDYIEYKFLIRRLFIAAMGLVREASLV